MIDIFNPEVSVVTEGVVGKKILIYGNAGTGKTSNAVKSPKPLVVAFENGLAAIPGVPNIKMKKWSDFRDFVKQLTDVKNFTKLREKYETIIIDGVDSIELLASAYICGIYGAPSIGQGNEGYGLWKEYAQEVQKQFGLLDSSGFTLIFLDHASTREFNDPTGNKYTKVYPAGDKRSIDPIINMCDIVAYAQYDKVEDEKLSNTFSTLYLRGNSAFEAKTRFDYMPSVIKNWSYETLSNEITKAINMRGGTIINANEAQSSLIEDKIAQEKNSIPLVELLRKISAMLQNMKAKTGNLTQYETILKEKVGNPNFKCTAATEDQKEVVEMVYNELLKLGY